MVLLFRGDLKLLVIAWILVGIFASRSVLNNSISWVTEPMMSTSLENSNRGCLLTYSPVKYFIRRKQTLNSILKLGLFNLLTFVTSSQLFINCLRHINTQLTFVILLIGFSTNKHEATSLFQSEVVTSFSASFWRYLRMINLVPRVLSLQDPRNEVVLVTN